MNTNVKNRKIQLDNRRYRKFIQKVLGLNYFLSFNSNDVFYTTNRSLFYKEIEKRKRKDLIEIKENIQKKAENNPFAYVLMGDEYFVFYYTNDDKKAMLYRDINGNEYSVSELTNHLSEDLVEMIIVNVSNDFNINNIDKNNRKINTDILFTNDLLSRKIAFPYSFILGTGISRVFDVGDWNNLIELMNRKISSKMNILLNDADYYEEFINKLGNKNYSIPQILKCIDEEYYKTIYENLYSSNFEETI